ncbi:uncharacterized protein LOC130449499 isoform X1 [Diorhabda sublineata]|uniref:uncharacterized protein LOC130449499 isoform X1 n=1 Tax=Diorhabda sublineata TaxID=1163346 RepID=UPI0024E06408|nr:uncharacterized protein LOC130449499 isoform X1 [Diorhabda sublineata]
MALSGKYKYVKDEGFENIQPRAGGDGKGPMKFEGSTLEIVVKDNDVTLTTTFSDGRTRKTEFEIGKEFEEKMGPNSNKNLGTLEGNVLTITSKSTEGTGGMTRIYTPSSSGIEVVSHPNILKILLIIKMIYLWG